MAKINAVVRNNRFNKNKQLKVEISIHHNKSTVYVDTGMLIDDALQFVAGAFTRKAKDYINKNIKLSEMLSSWSDAIDKVCDKNAISCKDMVASAQQYIRRASGHMTLRDVSEEFIKMKEIEGKLNHSQYCRWSVDKLCDYLKGDVRLADISMQVICSFASYLRLQKYSESYVNSNLARIKAILNFAQNFGYVKYEQNPFAMTKIRTSQVRDCAISVDYLIKYRDANIQLDTQAKARDVWMLSFYLCGANFKDIFNGNFKDDVFCYIRSKTAERVGDTISIPILPQAREIIDKYIKDDGSLDFGYSYTDYSNLLKFFAKKYRIAKDDIGMPSTFSYMSARKSFAQYASELGVPDGIIDYCLGHSLNKGGILRYYRRVTPRQAQMAMERVFDYVDNPSKYEDIMQFNMMMR